MYVKLTKKISQYYYRMSSWVCNACRELYYLALCMHCRPMMTASRISHHRPAMRAESQSCSQNLLPSTSGRKTIVLGATISGIRIDADFVVNRITRIRLFPLLLEDDFYWKDCTKSNHSISDYAWTSTSCSRVRI